MDPSLNNFVEAMAPKKDNMPYNSTPQAFRESIKKKSRNDCSQKTFSIRC